MPHLTAERHIPQTQKGPAAESRDPSQPGAWGRAPPTAIERKAFLGFLEWMVHTFKARWVKRTFWVSKLEF